MVVASTFVLKVEGFLGLCNVTSRAVSQASVVRDRDNIHNLSIWGGIRLHSRIGGLAKDRCSVSLYFLSSFHF